MILLSPAAKAEIHFAMDHYFLLIPASDSCSFTHRIPDNPA